MDSKEERLLYGAEAELVAIEILKLHKHEVISTKEKYGDKWSPLIDLREGDLHNLTRDILCDVKRVSCSLKSIREFTGHGFWIFNHWLTESIYVGTSEMQNIILPAIRKKKKVVKLSSGDYGIKYKDILTVKEWVRITPTPRSVLQDLVKEGKLREPKALFK